MDTVETHVGNPNKVTTGVETKIFVSDVIFHLKNKRKKKLLKYPWLGTWVLNKLFYFSKSTFTVKKKLMKI